jgi:16S rRNA processing protein RimM
VVGNPRRIEVGRLGAPHGVRGWLRVQSFMDPPQRLFDWQEWHLEREGGSPIEVKVVEARQQGNGWIARIAGVEERDAASRLTGHMILVDREELPPTSGREHYRADLVGFEASTRRATR